MVGGAKDGHGQSFPEICEGATASVGLVAGAAKPVSGVDL